MVDDGVKSDPGDPRLGLATSEQMLRELISRFKTTNGAAPPSTWMVDMERVAILSELLGGLDATEKEYRTVGY